MDSVALRQKIAVFTKGLEKEEDESIRRTVRRLLAEAESELARLKAPAGASIAMKGADLRGHYVTRAARPGNDSSGGIKNIIAGPQK